LSNPKSGKNEKIFEIVKKTSKTASMAYKPRPLPMPIELVLDSKHLKFAPGSVYRAVITITCLFWSSGGVLDGFDESIGAMIAKIPAGHWNAIKTPVMAALADLLPELSRRREIDQAKRDNMRRVLADGQAKGRAVVAFNRQKRNDLSQDKNQSQKASVPRTPAMLPRVVNPNAATAPAGMAQIDRVKGDEVRLADV